MIFFCMIFRFKMLIFQGVFSLGDEQILNYNHMEIVSYAMKWGFLWTNVRMFLKAAHIITHTLNLYYQNVERLFEKNCSFQWAMLVLEGVKCRLSTRYLQTYILAKVEPPPLTACIEKNGRAKWRCPRSQPHIPLEDTERTLHQQFLKEFYSLYLIASMYCKFYRHLP